VNFVYQLITLSADASHCVLSFVALGLQTSDRFTRTLAIFGQLLRGAFQFRALCPLQFRDRRHRGWFALAQLYRGRRATLLNQSWREGDLVAPLELGQALLQRFEREVALFQFELLLVEQLDQK
jgi:hypothetical protein